MTDQNSNVTCTDGRTMVIIENVAIEVSEGFWIIQMLLLITVYLTTFYTIYKVKKNLKEGNCFSIFVFLLCLTGRFVVFNNAYMDWNG